MKRPLSFVAALGMYFFASTAAFTQQVKLDTGGIAIGGSVSSSTISNRHPQRETGRAAAGFGLPHELISCWSFPRAQTGPQVETRAS